MANTRRKASAEPKCTCPLVGTGRPIIADDCPIHGVTETDADRYIAAKTFPFTPREPGAYHDGRDFDQEAVYEETGGPC